MEQRLTLARVYHCHHQHFICFFDVVLRIFDTLELTSNEAIDIFKSLKSCLKFLIVWIYEDWPLTDAPLQDWCILEWGGNISRWQWFFFGKLSWQWSKDPDQWYQTFCLTKQILLFVTRSLVRRVTVANVQSMTMSGQLPPVCLKLAPLPLLLVSLSI